LGPWRLRICSFVCGFIRCWFLLLSLLDANRDKAEEYREQKNH